MGTAFGLAVFLPALVAAQTPTLSFSRATVPGGYDVTVIIALKVAAPAAGVTLSLTSGAPTVARFAATGTGSQSITIPGGQRTASVSLRTLPVVADARVAIIAATASSSARASVTVQPLRPASVTMAINAAYGEGSVSAGEFVTITIAEPAPKEGLRLQLVSTLDAIAPVPFAIEAGATSAQIRFSTREVAQITPTLVGVAHADIAVADARRLVQGTAAPGVASLHLYPIPTIVSVAPSGRVVTLDANVRVRTTFAPAPVVSGAPIPRPAVLTVYPATGTLPNSANLFQEQSGSYAYGQTEMVTTHRVTPRTGERVRVGVGLLGKFAFTTFEFVAPALRVISLEPSRRTFAPNDSIQVTVKLEAPVQQARLSMPVSLGSATGVFVQGSSSVSVSGGQQTGTFTLVAGQFSTRRTIRVSVPAATAGGVITGPNGEATVQSASSTLISTDVEIVPVQLPQLKGVVPLQPTIAGGQSGIIEVRFTPVELTADQGNHPPHTLTLNSSDPAAAVAGTVTVDTRTTIAQVPITTTARVSDTRVTFTAAFNGTPVSGAAAAGTVLVTAPRPRVVAVSAARTSLAPGDSVPVTVTLDRPAPTSDVTVALSAVPDLALTLPASVNVPMGATTATFMARAVPTITVATTARITTPVTAALGAAISFSDGSVRTVTGQIDQVVSSGPISIVPLRVAQVSTNHSAVFGGIGDVELTVRLSAVTTSSLTVALNAVQPAICPLPSSLTVPAGSQEVRHRFTPARLTTDNPSVCTVTVELGGVPFSATSPIVSLVVHPVPPIVEIVPVPSDVVGGGALSAQVRFVAGSVPSLTSSSTAATIPLTITSNNAAVRGTTVMVPAGAASVGYTLPTSPVAAPTPVQLTYTLAGASTTRDFSLVPPPSSLVAWTLSRSTVIGGDTVTGSVSIDRPASAPVEILFTTTSSTVLAPTRVTIPAGAAQATVRIPTPRVTQGQSVTFTAVAASTTPDTRTGVVSPGRTATLTVEPLIVRQLLVDQPVGFGSVQRPSVTLILNAPAPSGGAKVVLTRSAPVITTVSGAAIPAVLTVPGGADRITVLLRTQQVEQLTDFTLSAFPAPEGSADGPFIGVIDAASPLLRTTPMQLLPIPILSNLRVEPATVVAGTAAVLLGDLSNSVRPTLTTATAPTLSLVVNSDRPDVVASGTVVVRPGDTSVRLDRPTTATTADATVRFTVTLVITRLGATLLVRAP